jgi:hypothetical protein
VDACPCSHQVETHNVPVAQEAVQHSGAGAKAETPSKNAARTPPACASRTQIAVPVSARVPICVYVASQRVWGKSTGLGHNALLPPPTG